MCSQRILLKAESLVIVRFAALSGIMCITLRNITLLKLSNKKKKMHMYSKHTYHHHAVLFLYRLPLCLFTCSIWNTKWNRTYETLWPRPIMIVSTPHNKRRLPRQSRSLIGGGSGWRPWAEPTTRLSWWPQDSFTARGGKWKRPEPWRWSRPPTPSCFFTWHKAGNFTAGTLFILNMNMLILLCYLATALPLILLP